MPLYEYECAHCGHKDAELRDVDSRDDPDMHCPMDGCDMERTVSLTSPYIGSTDRPTRGQG